ncbi:MAG: hypothetical protein CMD65_02035 [Gammaproteobacteria bacterium]|nr:hypothetical protein [Gammaproteobacteria bacterium]|tara:strand:+ start:2219 stop:3079 length:861 start_codon:yes stop_codon:yes gene_type:complete
MKLSITKNQAWSLILAIKSANNIKNNKKTQTFSAKISNKNISIVYNFDKRKVIKKNFISNEKLDQLFDIYLPIILNKKKGPYFIGHLAQTLDGFIATKTGESKYISDKENLEHIHRLRALADIIVVGSRTILLDNPKLTTRLVKGTNPIRVILDPNNKLVNNKNKYRCVNKNSIILCSNSKKNNFYSSVDLPIKNNHFLVKDIKLIFKKFNKKIIYIEGGGKTISFFYKNNILDRMHLCISPSILGNGKSSFIINKNSKIDFFRNLNTEFFKMGRDILYDIRFSVF